MADTLALLCEAPPVALDGEGEGAPVTIRIVPSGAFTTRDGRSYSVSDPAALVAETRRYNGTTDLVIDYEHQTAHSKTSGNPAPAAGWMKELTVREDGLYARVEWTKRAAAMLTAKEYRYLSPTFWHSQAGEVTRLHSAALTNTPALDSMALLTLAAGGPVPALPPAILNALGLPATTTEREIVDTIAQLKARQAAGTPDGDVARLVADLAQAKQANKAERVEQKVEKAISDLTLLPYLRDWALRFCSADEAGFDSLVGSLSSPYAHLTREMPFPALHPSRIATAHPEAASIAAQLGIDPAKLMGDK